MIASSHSSTHLYQNLLTPYTYTHVCVCVSGSFSLAWSLEYILLHTTKYNQLLYILCRNLPSYSKGSDEKLNGYKRKYIEQTFYKIA